MVDLLGFWPICEPSMPTSLGYERIANHATGSLTGEKFSKYTTVDNIEKLIVLMPPAPCVIKPTWFAGQFTCVTRP